MDKVKIKYGANVGSVYIGPSKTANVRHQDVITEDVETPSEPAPVAPTVSVDESEAVEPTTYPISLLDEPEIDTTTNVPEWKKKSKKKHVPTNSPDSNSEEKV